MNILVRKMTKEDIPQTAAIEREAFSVPWDEQGFAEAIAQEQNIFSVAECQGEIIGYCGMYTAADEGEITNVAVKEEFRKHGVGSRILAYMIRQAADKGIAGIYLEVRSSNEVAQKLYRKYGFLAVGTRKNFYRKPDEDAIVMMCQPEISTTGKFHDHL